MNTEKNNNEKPGALFYGVAGYITLVWAFFGLCFLVMLFKWVFPDSGHTTSVPNRSSIQVAAPATPARLYDSRPAVETDGTLQTLNARYATLLAKRNALQPNDQAAIAAFNVEAAEYRKAVDSFRATRAAQLQLPTSQSGSIVLPSSSSVAIPTANEFYVPGYVRSNGTVVSGYYRTVPDGTKSDNYSTQGNVNPHTGRPGTVRP